jgi:transcriptional regulator with XRE-family HTH domain
MGCYDFPMLHPIEQYLAENPGMTRAALAERAGVSRMTLWRLTKGEGEFSTALLKQIAKATDGAVTITNLAAALPCPKPSKRSSSKRRRASTN